MSGTKEEKVQRSQEQVIAWAFEHHPDKMDPYKTFGEQLVLASRLFKEHVDAVDAKKAELPPGAIRLDPAVAAAKRLITTLNAQPRLRGLIRVINDDIVIVCSVILQIAGHQIVDKTGDAVPVDNVTTKE